jgi:hypothetical protein
MTVTTYQMGLCSTYDDTPTEGRGKVYLRFENLPRAGAGRHLAHILMCPRHESQEMAWLVTSSAQANLIDCACAAQRGAR